nr:YdcH family protein [Luteibacter sp. Sphag1AF]
MFENQQRDDVEAYMSHNPDFRRLYHRHRDLDSIVHNADIGVLPVDDSRLKAMKTEKLRVKTLLERMWRDRQPVH